MKLIMVQKNNITENKIRAVIITALRTAALLCASGSLMQTFLSVTGFSEQHIYLHATFFQAVNVLTILLCARFADTGNVLRKAAIVQLPCGVLFLFYLPLCSLQNVSAVSYLWLLLIGILQSVTIALHTVCEYKLPYYVFRIQEYGMISAVCGILSSVVSFGTGTLISIFCTQFSYNRIMLISFSISCVLLLVAGILQYFQKSLITESEKTDAEKQIKKLPLSYMFRHDAFSKLFLGNLTRGYANGTTTVLAAAALSIGYNETLTSVMVSVQSLASLAACAIFALISQKIHPRYVILIGSFCFLSLPVLLCQQKTVLYLAMYAILLFGRTLIDYAVPAALLYAVPVEIAGTYNAWRMILHNGGTMLATISAGFIPLPVLFFLTLVCQLVSGINFFTSQVIRRK